MQNVQDVPSRQTDDGCLPATRITSENAYNEEIPESDDTRTVYSDASSLSVWKKKSYISEFADDLFNKVHSERPDSRTIDRISRVLPNLLKAFALKVGYNAPTQIHRDIILPDVQTSDSGKMPLNELMNLWGKNLAPDDGLTSDRILFRDDMNRWDPDLKDQEDDVPADLKDQHFNEEAEEEQNEEMNTLQLFSYRDFICKAPAYEWLLASLHRELLLTPAEPNHMEAIKQAIIKTIPSSHKISRKKSAEAYKIIFEIQWDPLTFINEQSYKELYRAVENVITLTGSAKDAQALTCAQYLHQTWPLTGYHIIQLVKNVLNSRPGNQHTCDLPDNTKLTAWIHESRFMVEAFGTGDSVAEIGEQFAWLGAALRPSPYELGVAYSTPFIEDIQVESSPGHPKSGTQSWSKILCKINFRVERGEEQVELSNGQCWHNLFRNPVVVKGYPIPRRSEYDTGLEMPLNIMAALAHAQRVTIFGGKLFIKGFCTMLILTKYVEDMVIWHMIFNEDGSHISYVDPRIRNILGAYPESVDVLDLERARHVIGWCSNVKSYAGTSPDADYDIGWSGLEEPQEGSRLENVSISIRRPIILGESPSVGNKDTPDRHKGDHYVKRLMWIAQMFVVLYDVGDRRAWLIDGASALLHLVRASLKRSRRDDFHRLFLFKPENMEEADTTIPGKAAAIAILTSDTNKRIRLYKSSVDCFNDRVEEILHILEQIMSYEEKAGGDGATPRQQLEGFDFMNVATVKNWINPRVAILPTEGMGWVDFTKAIHAVTLFGKGFGELIRPTNSKELCSFWNKVPVDRDYLTVCVSDVENILEMEGSKNGALWRLSKNVYWHKPGHIFEACLCVSDIRGRHSDRVQVLLPRCFLNVKGKASNDLKSPHQLECSGAVIFGHSSQFPLRWGDYGDPEKVDPKEGHPKEAEPSPSSKEVDSPFHDSGVGSGTGSSSIEGAENLAPTSSEDSRGNESRSRNDFEIAIICALPLEAEAVDALFDDKYKVYDQIEGDMNAYSAGRVGSHDIVLVHMPNIGKSNATGAAANLRTSFIKIKFVLLVGICGGIPFYSDEEALCEIVLGDVIIGDGVVQFDIGKQFPDHFQRKAGFKETLGRPNLEIRGLLSRLKISKRLMELGEKTSRYLEALQGKLNERFRYPGVEQDRLFESSYHHVCSKSRELSCQELGCQGKPVHRKRLTVSNPRPVIHIGTIVSGDTVMMSGEDRDVIAHEEKIIAFEMEGAGVWDNMPCVVIKGVCDYADSHKNKKFQRYAAATAAACAKAFLEERALISPAVP
ncbi:hypothetical protein F5884DRAFT_712243 [Xylogone sp. PMI_703]|nr:hypothetical protein F5884DRAFT_712243 [Xylogone sp. PMI_703]